MNAKELVSQMSLEEKASLCSGLDFWNLKGIERLNLTPVMVTDGPHGLRKQEASADNLGINKSIPATCFPTSSATACSFDRELLREIGAAIGEECLQERVSVLLGPGLNIKRSPLCGRNFEYFSEDPYLSGEMAAAIVSGVQDKGVGTSVKHYAANNQETRRMTIDSVVDERALRELYLSGFEAVIKTSQPWTVMCSYNRLDGTYLSENKRLLNDILRDEWGYDGLVMSDWGATADRAEGVRAGLDLEMPSSGGVGDARIVAAVKDGSLDEKTLDKTAIRVVELILKAQANRLDGYRYDAEAHHTLARRAAAESCVLLKNDGGALPLISGKSLAVIGAFARTPRYQGAGSSRITPSRMDSLFDALTERGISFDYADGYSLKKHAPPDDKLIAAAVAAAKDKELVIIAAGLPAEYESEGFDRTTLNMPESHTRLIEAVASVNPNVAIVLQCGAPIAAPWAERVRAVLLCGLGGQAGGSGCADVLTGAVNPSGKLAETYPLTLEDTPCAAYFPGGEKTVEYRESIFVGYRYYDASAKSVAWPFGHGLSYTAFAYSDLTLNADGIKSGDSLDVTFTVTNTGLVAGAEIAQLYIGLESSAIFRAARELKGFEKVFLQPGESKNVTMTLDTRAFSYYNVASCGWAIEGGTYTISVGASSRHILLTKTLTVEGDGKETLLASLRTDAPAYFNLSGGGIKIPDRDFAAVLGRPIPPANRLPGEGFTLSNTLGDIAHTFIGKKVMKQVKKQTEALFGSAGDDDNGMDELSQSMLTETPLRSLGMMSGGMLSEKKTLGIIDMANGRLLRGLLKFLGK